MCTEVCVLHPTMHLVVHVLVLLSDGNNLLYLRVPVLYLSTYSCPKQCFPLVTMNGRIPTAGLLVL